jgi:hypothetical protein
MKEATRMKILALFANPRGTDTIRLGEEDRVLKECIRRSKNRENVELTILHAATVDDARRALLDDAYDIVHFSGHGTGTGLAFEDSRGRLYIPPRDALAELLKAFSPPLQCVLLNACYSTSQGSLTSLGIPFTIAMEGPIADDAAILFSGGFYDSLSAGKDVEFSFHQGLLALKLGGHADSIVPRLIPQGETVAPRAVAEKTAATRIDRETTVQAQEATPPLLIGVGIDVSGSMESSINNRVGARQSRLAAFRDALTRGASSAQRHLGPVGGSGSKVSLFAYAFGLRDGGVCDLLSLVKAVPDLVSQDEIERLKRKHTAALMSRYSGMSGLESLARQYLGSGAIDSLKASARAQGEAEVKNAIFAEIAPRLRSRLNSIGETTLGLDEFLDLWKSSESAIGNAEGFIYGNTPMCEALRMAKNRFIKEQRRPPSLKQSIFLLASDGESTDGDPTKIGAEMLDLGITVIGCYITDHDVIEPRALLSQPLDNWSKGARDMFHMSSIVSDDSDLARYLLREGWHISKGARAFVQANHSDLLEELVAMALSPLEAGQRLLPKGV